MRLDKDEFAKMLENLDEEGQGQLKRNKVIFERMRKELNKIPVLQRMAVVDALHYDVVGEFTNVDTMDRESLELGIQLHMARLLSILRGEDETFDTKSRNEYHKWMLKRGYSSHFKNDTFVDETN